MSIPTIVQDVAIAVGLIALAWGVAVFTQGPGIEFVYFAF